MKMKIGLILTVILVSSPCFADRTLECDLDSGRVAFIRAKSPNIFPRDYASITFQETTNGQVKVTKPYPLELLYGNRKAGTFRFFLGDLSDGSGTSRHGILSMNGASLFVDVTSHGLDDAPAPFSYAGDFNCRTIEINLPKRRH